MKKIILTFCIALYAVSSASANSIQIINMTSCTIYGITQGGMISVPPSGNVFYASPANIANPGAPPSGTFSSITFDTDPTFTNPIYAGPGAYTCGAATPTICAGGLPFCWAWTLNPASNIALIYF